MRKYLITCLFLLSLGALSAQTEAHFQKTEHRVYDYSGILSSEQFSTLESRLYTFEDSTSNQIVVIYTPTLYGEEIKDLGTRIGHAWGVGQKEYNNGLMIIIKTKTAEEPDGDVAILPGYGLGGDYYQAVLNALDIIEPVCRGEYDFDRYKEDNDDDDPFKAILGFIIWGCIILYVVRRLKRGFFGGGGFSGGSSGGSSYGGYHSSSSGSSYSSRSFGGGGFGGGGASRKF